LVLYYSIYKIASHLFKNLFSKFNYFLIVTIFIAGFHFSTFNHIEVWWWISSSICYLQGLIFLLLGVVILLENKKTKLYYTKLFICFLLAGGFFELYSIIILALVFALLIINNYSHKKILQNKSLYIATSAFLLSSIINFIAPGNFSRKIVLNNISGNELNFFDLFLEPKFIISILFASVFILIGCNYKKRGLFLNTKKAMLLSFSSFLISLLITILFQKIILYNYPIPTRAISLASLLFYIFICICFFVIGYSFKKNKLFQLIHLSSYIVIIIVMSYITSRQYNYVSKYTTAYDNLITSIKEAEKKGEKIYYYKALPNSGMLVYLYLNDYAATPMKDVLEVVIDLKISK